MDEDDEEDDDDSELDEDDLELIEENTGQVMKRKSSKKCAERATRTARLPNTVLSG